MKIKNLLPLLALFVYFNSFDIAYATRMIDEKNDNKFPTPYKKKKKRKNKKENNKFTKNNSSFQQKLNQKNQIIGRLIRKRDNRSLKMKEETNVKLAIKESICEQEIKELKNKLKEKEEYNRILSEQIDNYQAEIKNLEEKLRETNTIISTLISCLLHMSCLNYS